MHCAREPQAGLVVYTAERGKRYCLRAEVGALFAAHSENRGAGAGSAPSCQALLHAESPSQGECAVHHEHCRLWSTLSLAFSHVPRRSIAIACILLLWLTSGVLVPFGALFPLPSLQESLVNPRMQAVPVPEGPVPVKRPVSNRKTRRKRLVLRQQQLRRTKGVKARTAQAAKTDPADK